MKKNINIIIESNSSLKDVKREFKMTFRAYILEIVLNGLKTLNTLKEDRLLLPPPLLINLGSHL